MQRSVVSTLISALVSAGFTLVFSFSSSLSLSSFLLGTTPNPSTQYPPYCRRAADKRPCFSAFGNLSRFNKSVTDEVSCHGSHPPGIRCCAVSVLSQIFAHIDDDIYVPLSERQTLRQRAIPKNRDFCVYSVKNTETLKQ